ncbi:hypothetical protein AC622_12760 [Bacillus sp. FJAT-27916]|uniref:hypothetical protein n=1 Tax=Bacillus sp. FJAT-27916 TaxID=1679169 RepID=UPI0006708A28|nr:hypothetical protein [Bacillus sp. FJAT-27916]KMY44984.1 hypothetical protein AC622_12760 [Bacillus sp. FJAT-27916]
MVLVLIVSMMVNLAAILAIIILYLRQNRLFQMEENMHANTENIENLLTAFLVEMKEDNGRLKAALVEKADVGQISKEEGAAALSAEEKERVLPENSRENFLLLQALRLKGQGNTVEQIAKVMGRGKTEIELLIKMNE